MILVLCLLWYNFGFANDKIVLETKNSKVIIELFNKSVILMSMPDDIITDAFKSMFPELKRHLDMTTLRQWSKKIANAKNILNKRCLE